MFEPVNYVITLLNLLCLTIFFRKWVRVSSSSLFTGGWLLGASVLIFCVISTFPPLPALLGCLVVVFGYVRFIFEGSAKKILLLLLAFFLAYGLCAAIAWVLLSRAGFLDYSFQIHLDRLSATLLAQQLFYTLLFVLGNIKDRTHYSITYYFPILPLIITLFVLAGFRQQEIPGTIRPYLSYGLLLLLIFDYLSLVFQGWLIISLHTRMRLRQEQARREYLAGKYAVLTRQYETSFGFLHSLLRQCADLSLYIEAEDLDQISHQVKDMAQNAFSQFNEVCISSPVLSSLLSARKKELEQRGILVSCAIRNDQFGLITFDEQKLLFGRLLDFAIDCAETKDRKLGTIIIRSGISAQDLLLDFNFSCAEDPSSFAELEELRVFLSSRFKAGVRSVYSSEEGRMQIFVVIPLGLDELYTGTPFAPKTQTGRSE